MACLALVMLTIERSGAEFSKVMQREKTRTFRRGCAWPNAAKLAVCAICVGAVLCGLRPAAAQAANSALRANAARAYRQAQTLRARLEAHPGQSPANYQRVVRAFQLVYRTDPGYPKTPAALAAAAEIYEEMGRQFVSDRYYSKAIRAYQFLAVQYPHGRLAVDAVFAVAEIYRTKIENPVEARAAYEQFLKQFPRSSKAADAQRAIAKIDHRLARWPATSSPKLAPAALVSPRHGRRSATGLAEVESIRHWTGPNYTRVVVRVASPVTFNALHLQRPPRLVFDLAGTRLSPDLARKTFPVQNGFLQRVRVAQFKPSVTRLVLDVPQIEDYSVFSLPNPFRLIIDIHGRQSGAPLEARSAKPAATNLSPLKQHAISRQVTGSPAAAAHGEQTALSGVTPPALSSLRPGLSPTLTRALGLKIRRIVIDPGHGGKDTGTIGPTGLEEKNLVLDVGLRLRKLIERRMGCQVIMTRSTDVFVPLEERTAIANEAGADLFISIHANASSDPAARGVETYYLNFTSDPAALRLAARENASSEDSVYQLQSLIKKIALTEKIDESRQFAKVVDDQLVAHLDASGDPQRNRGVKEAPFVVLIGANMPSILAEISFVTNPRDERLLREGSVREKIAVGLYDGIVRYAATLGTIHIAERSSTSAGQHNTPSF